MASNHINKSAVSIVRHCYSLRSAHTLSSDHHSDCKSANCATNCVIKEPALSSESSSSIIMMRSQEQLVGLSTRSLVGGKDMFSLQGADGEAEEGGGGGRGQQYAVMTDGSADDRPAAAGKRRRKKFVGVRQRPSGRWVAEIKDTTQKIRMWLGTFDTAEDAARAYDEAACLLRGTNTRTNFVPSPLKKTSPALASKVAHMLHARRSKSIPTAAAAAPSNCTTNPLPAPGPNRSINHTPIPSVNHPPCRQVYHHQLENQGLPFKQHSPIASDNNEAHSSFHHAIWTESSKANHSAAWRFCTQRAKSECVSSDSEPPPDADCSINALWERKNAINHNHDDQRAFVRDKRLISANEEMDLTDHQQIFTGGKQLIQSNEDIDDHQLKLHYRGSFMDAVLGISDDIILGSSDQLNSMASFYTNSPFDFSVESSLGSSIMQVDDFPLINELSSKLEEAERGNRDNNIDDDDGCNSSNNNLIAKGSQLMNSEEIKRMRFERRVSASLYALNGVHEVLKQTQLNPIHPTTNSTAISSFNFLNTSPSYMFSSPWKAYSSSLSSSTSAGGDSTTINTWKINGAINTPPVMPSSSSAANTSDPASSTIIFSNLGSSDSTIDNNNNNSDAQSQQEAAMWSSWDLSPLCPLSVA